MAEGTSCPFNISAPPAHGGVLAAVDLYINGIILCTVLSVWLLSLSPQPDSQTL